MGIYLDYNASAPVDERVLDAMVDVYRNTYGNADSRTHDYGDHARKLVENARKQVASLLGVNAGEVFFTSGSTESNNIAIRGLIDYANKTGKKHVITSTIEHKAVLETVKSLANEGFQIDLVNPDERGRVNADEVLRLVREDTLLVSLMHANNETGTIQPVKEVGEELSKKGVFFHVDATQSCGKLVPEMKAIKYDMLSLSGHKLCGPQGIGALVLRKKKYKLPPIKAITYGGQQEHGIRPGTIPVALVVGLGEACRLAETEYEANIESMIEKKKIVKKLIEKSGLAYQYNGSQDFCMPNTLNVSFNGVESEALMLSTKQYCSISNGSACTSQDYSPSYVLTAMGLDQDRISSAIRLSWGAKTNKDELISQLLEVVNVAKGLVF
ncbi:aminotransferase class V-fold PLP-dependent enzyme [Anaerocolumna sp. AGMB13025]|uniref:cysteine desulfurase family protein n=1 Tax=Anaerocolumna sp. AGMB13025 TaxID=3039116 RepID=UPI00241F83C3|nr:aminotransferase class V-fold PLP-dependent enzyme [Anaerocolumna sp. AGMB13025]WFR58136.1 aminotransferase class V-fold PLP-dependent enzyme [Anaerocolumna sp. AGMB13025]